MAEETPQEKLTDFAQDPIGEDVTISSDEIVISLNDARVIRDALKTAYWHSVSHDFVQAYRNLDTDGTRSRSPLTSHLSEALVKAQAHVKLGEGSSNDSQNEED